MTERVRAWPWLAFQCLLSMGCADDCNVEQTATTPKISASLRQQMQGAGEDVAIAVVITATTVRAVACVNEAIVHNEGPVARGVPTGTRSTLASLPAHAIEAVATRADVERIGVSFEEGDLP